MRRVSVLIPAIIGVVIGAILSALLYQPLTLLPGIWGKIIPSSITVFLCLLFVILLIIKSKDISSIIFRFSEERGERFIVDTNAIIDGRIGDLMDTGFIRGTLIVPGFVLDELRHIADSQDPLRRNRGRRGLDVLSRLQGEKKVEVIDVDFPELGEVDAKIVRLAKALSSSVITNDVNLGKIASLQGVKVLNLNELAKALKPIVFPGEEVKLKIIHEGKEIGQGVGYLEDGTMVVVERGRRFINEEIDVIISRVLQTPTGRIIFAMPKETKGG